MREQIGQTAGKIWQVLGQKGELNVALLPKTLQEKSDLTFQALGWLAHEGKIIYRKKDNKNFVALNNHEQVIFRTVH